MLTHHHHFWHASLKEHSNSHSQQLPGQFWFISIVSTSIKFWSLRSSINCIQPCDGVILVVSSNPPVGKQRLFS